MGVSNMSGDRIFERLFVAYGVRIGLRVTGGHSSTLSNRIPHACSCRSAGARLKTTSLMTPYPSGTSFVSVIG